MSKMFSGIGEASVQRVARSSQMPEPGRIGRICLECAAIFRHLPLTIRCRLGDYTRAMMIKRILTICAAVFAAVAAAGAQAGGCRRRAIRRRPARPIRLIRPVVLPPIIAAARRPDFDALDDDEDRMGGVRPRCRRPVRCFRRMIRAMAGRWALRPVYSDRDGRPVRCFRRTIRAMAVRWARRRSIPTVRRRPCDVAG